MSTYLGWNVITMPATPPAPQSIEFKVVNAVAMSISPFTGQQQTQDWGGSWMEAIAHLPPLTHTQAVAWVQFLRDLKGSANVTQFTSAFQAAYSDSIASGQYWRLKKPEAVWSISQARMYGITLEFIEAK